MARRRNYGFERKQREAARVSRLEAKKARKTERDESGQSGPEMGDAQETSAPPAGQWEWFSPSRGRVVITAEGQRPQEAPDDWTLLTEGAEDPGS
jgi:hypothetical protein